MQTTVALQDTRLPAAGSEVTRALAIAVLGAIAIGACLGLREGAGAMSIRMLAMPFLLGGIVVVTGPALFVGLALVGEAPPLSDFLNRGARAFGDVGILLLGLTPPTLFLMGSVRMAVSSGFLAFFVVGFAYLVGVRSLAHRLAENKLATAGMGVLVAWSILTARIGVHGLEKLVLY